MDRLDGLHRGVFAAESFEVFAKERLNSQRDPGDAEFFVESCGALGEGRGIGFEGDFFDLGKVEVRAESFEEFSQVSRREHGGRSSAEVDCFERSEVFLGEELCFGDQGVNEGSEVGISRSVLVK